MNKIIYCITIIGMLFCFYIGINSQNIFIIIFSLCAAYSIIKLIFKTLELEKEIEILKRKDNDSL